VGSGPPRQGQGGGTGADTAIEWLPGRSRLRHVEQTTGWASGMKAVLAAAIVTTGPMILGAVPATASNVFVANQDPTAQDIWIDRFATIPLNSIPSPTSSAVCTPQPVEPATITVTGVVGKVGQPEVYTVALLGTCHVPPDSIRPTGTAIAMVFTDPRAKDMASHVTDLAYAPPPATNLVGVRAPDGASVFSGPADARSASRIRSSWGGINDTDSRAATFTYGYSSAPDASGDDVQRKTEAHTGAMTVTVARSGEYGMAGPALDRFRSTDGDRNQPADAWALHTAAEPSSVFVMQPDTTSVLPANDFAWRVGTAVQTPNPNFVGRGALPSLSATVSRHGASRTYANVLAAIP
jgi:hypothetical protein